jgi:hypothetical protein
MYGKQFSNKIFSKIGLNPDPEELEDPMIVPKDWKQTILYIYRGLFFVWDLYP